MMHITEDTPPDMLAGAMDLTVHLPNGNSIKMPVERSTPMMDLLVQITTVNHLQLSNYTLQVLGMAPSSKYSDKVLPFKPNTPIGTLDTQHIRVLPKEKSVPAIKYVAPGHQPFESTFRLKVHLPRNQLYVTRVSRNVLLQDIMKKVCEEKNLHPLKYDFKHPGNLDEVLNPKLTLSDYQITEIYVVAKGTTDLNQAFSPGDIMVLRKEEERKQMHNKTGGGVFNLIFKRGKSNMGSGSVSSENRSISPTHSDDSRSVTPPAIQPSSTITTTVPSSHKNPPSDKPKAPQRKRRPAPKPPQFNNDKISKSTQEKSSSAPSSQIASSNTDNENKSSSAENGLTICHSRNSSDSSGYHEASILSEHGGTNHNNTSLPRISRPKSLFVGNNLAASQSTSNLTKMSIQSRSTTSLIAGRKKKAAPLPPPVASSSANSVVVVQSEPEQLLSPLVASQSNLSVHHPTPLSSSASAAELAEVLETTTTSTIPCNNFPPKPKPRQRFQKITSSATITENENTTGNDAKDDDDEVILRKNGNSLQNISSQRAFSYSEQRIDAALTIINPRPSLSVSSYSNIKSATLPSSKLQKLNSPQRDYSMEDILTNLEAVKPFIMNTAGSASLARPRASKIVKSDEDDDAKKETRPEIVGVIPKTPKADDDDDNGNDKDASSKSSFGKKRCFNSENLIEFDCHSETASINSKKSSSTVDIQQDIEIFDIDDKNMFEKSSSRASRKEKTEVFNHLYRIHHHYSYDEDEMFNRRKSSITSLCSTSSSVPSGMQEADDGLKKRTNFEELNKIYVNSAGNGNRWVNGDGESDTESMSSANFISKSTIIHDTDSDRSRNLEEKNLESTDSGITPDTHLQLVEFDKSLKQEESGYKAPVPPPILDDDNIITTGNNNLRSDEQTLSAVEPPSLSAFSSATENFRNSLHPYHQLLLSQPDKELEDIEWQYQLPSPPKAFRDSISPNNNITTNLEYPQNNNNDSISMISRNSNKDSVVTSPELFEKLKFLAEKDDNIIKSELTTINSVTSEDDHQPLLNTLSLEHLEKRKSLVYNRELATSLKMTDSVKIISGNNNNNNNNKGASSRSEFHTLINNKNNSNNNKETPEISKPIKPVKPVNLQHNTLPNFKISTYDVPKHQNITVFEDDTIRSNNNNIHGSKINLSQSTDDDDEKESFANKKRHSVDGNMENLKNQSACSNNGRYLQTVISRSGSFSTENLSPSKPSVSRSKSTLALNKYPNVRNDEEISRSNSLFDVSGLQSLEVMKLIRNKLSSPMQSTENLHQNSELSQKAASPSTVVKGEGVRLPDVPETSSVTVSHLEPVRKFYRGLPAVNMSTWSERAKVPVSVKEDADYKLGVGRNSSTSRLLMNSTTTNAKTEGILDANNDQITQNSGNVIIKINGNSQQNGTSSVKPSSIDRFMAPLGFRKPFSSINGGFLQQRPHSIALDDNFDINRVPIVKSVELKKSPNTELPNNTSITHLNQSKDDFSYKKVDSFVEKFRSTENLRSFEKQDSGDSSKNNKIFRVGSLFRPSENNYTSPTVRGFKGNHADHHQTNNRLSWNSSNYINIPIPVSQNNKPSIEKEYSTNQQVPFSQSRLRRTESTNLYSSTSDSNNMNKNSSSSVIVQHNNKANTAKSINNSNPQYSTYNNVKNNNQLSSRPPPPPIMPKTLKKVSVIQGISNNSCDNRKDLLMDEIRNFGGKKGLKSVKSG